MLPQGKHVRLGGGKYGKLLRGSELTETSAVGKEIAKRKHIATAYPRPGKPPRRRPTHRPGHWNRRSKRLGGSASPWSSSRPRARWADASPSASAMRRESWRLSPKRRRSPRRVVIESFIEGELYRLLTIGGRFFAASRRLPAQVTGDGQATVRELVERANQHPARRVGRIGLRSPIQLDKEALACLTDQGLTLESRPAAGESRHRLSYPESRPRRRRDRRHRRHPRSRSGRSPSAPPRLLGIDVCGVDFITTDPTRPYWETGGAICEVNTRPGFDIHWAVSEGAVA